MQYVMLAFFRPLHTHVKIPAEIPDKVPCVAGFPQFLFFSLSGEAAVNQPARFYIHQVL